MTDLETMAQLGYVGPQLAPTYTPQPAGMDTAQAYQQYLGRTASPEELAGWGATVDPTAFQSAAQQELSLRPQTNVDTSGGGLNAYSQATTPASSPQPTATITPDTAAANTGDLANIGRYGWTVGDRGQAALRAPNQAGVSDDAWREQMRQMVQQGMPIAEAYKRFMNIDVGSGAGLDAAKASWGDTLDANEIDNWLWAVQHYMGADKSALGTGGEGAGAKQGMGRAEIPTNMGWNLGPTNNLGLKPGSGAGSSTEDVLNQLGISGAKKNELLGRYGSNLTTDQYLNLMREGIGSKPMSTEQAYQKFMGITAKDAAGLAAMKAAWGDTIDAGEVDDFLWAVEHYLGRDPSTGATGQQPLATGYTPPGYATIPSVGSQTGPRGTGPLTQWATTPQAQSSIQHFNTDVNNPMSGKNWRGTVLQGFLKGNNNDPKQLWDMINWGVREGKNFSELSQLPGINVGPGQMAALYEELMKMGQEKGWGSLPLITAGTADAPYRTYGYNAGQKQFTRGTDKVVNPLSTYLKKKSGGLVAVQEDPVAQRFITGGRANYVKTGAAGGGQKDNVPALLSDKEYVMDADVVSALGDGDPDEGARKLDKMRENIRTHKRSASSKSIPPKAKAPEKYLKGK